MLKSVAGKATLARIVAVFLVVLAAFLIAGCSERAMPRRRSRRVARNPRQSR
jgi:hypothetical protein